MRFAKIWNYALGDIWKSLPDGRSTKASIEWRKLWHRTFTEHSPKFFFRGYRHEADDTGDQPLWDLSEVYTTEKLMLKGKK